MPSLTHPLGFCRVCQKGLCRRSRTSDGEPAIVQSTARVYRGDSGGMLLDDEGKLIGVVTSNARSFDGSIIPSINFSVPKNLFAPLVEPKNAIEHMERLDRADQNLDALWNLEDVRTASSSSCDSVFSFQALSVCQKKVIFFTLLQKLRSIVEEVTFRFFYRFCTFFSIIIS